MSDRDERKRRDNSDDSSDTSTDSDDGKKANRKRKDSDSSVDSNKKEEKVASKRSADVGDDDDDSDDDFVGPSLADAAPQRKKRVLEYESVYLDNLPSGMNYERSFMHRDVVTHVVVTPTDFVITASQDGHIKFWKKQEVGIEFVKHFRAHLGTINDLTVNATGSLLATIASDKAVKVFDVVNFDMINMLKLDFIPSCVTWIHKPGDAINELAVAEENSPIIRVYDGKGSTDPLKTLKIHMKPVLVMTYCHKFDIVISSDQGGMVEYWSGSGQDYNFPKQANFQSKLDTDLYEFAKNKTFPLNMTVSPDGGLVVMMGDDRKIRMFRLLTGKSISNHHVLFVFDLFRKDDLCNRREFESLL